MRNKTRILQIGLENWESYLSEQQKEHLDWIFLDLNNLNILQQVEEITRIHSHGTFEGVICTDKLCNTVLSLLDKKIEAYSLIIDKYFEKKVNPEIKKRKCPLFLSTQNRDYILQILITSFFSWQGGSTLHTNMLFVHPGFDGKKNLQGENYLRLEGDFSSYISKPLVNWQSDIKFINKQNRKVYLNYQHSKEVTIFLDIHIYSKGGVNIVETRSYNESLIKEGINIEFKEGFESMGFSIRAEGEGQINIGILHIQDSRNGYGEYLLGGQRLKDSNNHDLYYYFNPGDLKPPLTVYFAGYHSGKGFEGFFRMKKTGAPFLLITDSRLEGGSFYMGSKELEERLVDVIKSSLKYLEFTNHDLILSGLSMGTTGALYYAKDLRPHAVLVGKPLTNIGDVAQNHRLVRPGEFSTSLDIQYAITGGLSKEDSDKLNTRFWDKFDFGMYESTVFIVAYMLDDDYDKNAYHNLQEHLSSQNSQLISKGISGRHNDNTPSINSWFFGQHQRLLQENFGREEYDAF